MSAADGFAKAVAILKEISVFEPPGKMFRA
jgi:hypothetical protein